MSSILFLDPCCELTLLTSETIIFQSKTFNCYPFTVKQSMTKKTKEDKLPERKKVSYETAHVTKTDKIYIRTRKQLEW